MKREMTVEISYDWDSPMRLLIGDIEEAIKGYVDTFMIDKEKVNLLSVEEVSNEVVTDKSRTIEECLLLEEEIVDNKRLIELILEYLRLDQPFIPECGSDFETEKLREDKEECAECKSYWKCERENSFRKKLRGLTNR